MSECFPTLDRFYVVAKFKLPRVEDLKLTTIEFASKCTYLARNDTHQLVIFQNIWCTV